MAEEKQESIIDTSRPNAGRMYDYYLGGNHNFEVDRQAAEQVMQMLPFASTFARIQRWCLQDIAREITQKRGYDVVIDFASGLPTQDHIHVIAPEGTTVIYSDKDPIAVEYSREIIKDVPNVYCFEADAGRPEELLSRPEVKSILNGRRDVAMVIWGVAIFMSDKELERAISYLYDWSGDKSCLVFQAQAAGADKSHPDTARTIAIYEQMGSPFHVRSLEWFEDLVKPWKTDKRGFIPILDWHGLDDSMMSEHEREVFGNSGAGYGVYLTK